MKDIMPNTVESSELVEQTFKFWFSDNEHIRSPFPTYIQSQLKELAVNKFFEWTAGLNPQAKDEVNDEIVAEKFEEIIFESALPLVLTEDERITIQYPFLPRLGDEIADNDNSEVKSAIIDRSFTKDGDHHFMKVVLEREGSNEKWETKFELPA